MPVFDDRMAVRVGSRGFGLIGLWMSEEGYDNTISIYQLIQCVKLLSLATHYAKNTPLHIS
jgi:hypothetical protein